jgi:hypothetical protein
MEAALHAWLDNITPSIDDRNELAALGLYVRTTVQLLKLVDCRYVLQYHRACASAAELGRYHPLHDGEVYPLAYSMHITPHLMSGKSFNRSQRDWPSRGGKGRKRKAEGSPSRDSSPRCTLPGHGSHTVAECYTRHPELRPTQKGDGKRPSSSSAKKSKAADDAKES